MEKYLKVSQGSGFGLRTLGGDTAPSLGIEPPHAADQVSWMERTSSIDPRLAQYIAKNPLDHARYTYVLVAPLGADQSWEETVNGDGFDRDHLRPPDGSTRYGHKTFEERGCAFMHHRNKDPQGAGFGDFPLSVYNEVMDRVEALWRLDHERAKRVVGAEDLIQAYRRGKDYPISMGCQVPYDCCTLCGNLAPSPSKYCRCVRDPGLGSIDPDTGQKMRLLNPYPVFFDLSGVSTNAAPEATPLGWVFPELEAFLRQTLSRQEKRSSMGEIITVSPQGLQDYLGGQRRRAGHAKHSHVGILKASDMIKMIPILRDHLLRPTVEHERTLPDAVLDLSGGTPLGAKVVLSSLAGLGIVATPGEFARLHHKGFDPCARYLPSDEEAAMRQSFAAPSRQEEGHYLRPLAVRGDVLFHALPHVHERSICLPFLAPRVLSRALASSRVRSGPRVEVRVDVDGVAPGDLGSAYGIYLREAIERMAHQLVQTLRAFPTAWQTLEQPLASLAPGQDLQVYLKGGGGAQALLPSAYLLSMAGALRDAAALMGAAKSLNGPQVGHLFGGFVPGAA